MELEEIDTIDLPLWALCYLTNADTSGLTDEDIALADTWEASYGAPITIETEGNTYFTYYPEFGKACDCVDATIYRHHN